MLQKRVVARDRNVTFQELADEAFRNLPRKYGRSTDLEEALQRGATASSKVVPPKRPKEARRKREAKRRRWPGGFAACNAGCRGTLAPVHRLPTGRSGSCSSAAALPFTGG
jgi:hypothetical protein